MKISADNQKALSIILIYTALLCFLIGLAARLKESFHSRAEISMAAFTIAATLAGLAAILFLFSLRRKQG